MASYNAIFVISILQFAVFKESIAGPMPYPEPCKESPIKICVDKSATCQLGVSYMASQGNFRIWETKCKCKTTSGIWCHKGRSSFVIYIGHGKSAHIGCIKNETGL